MLWHLLHQIGGCLIELAQQLAVIMVGKQCINNAQEIIIPKLKAWWHQKKLEEGGREVESQIESDYRLVGNEGLFQEYLEMVLQFGFITIFVAAFPLAPLFALLNNWVEIRLDAQKFVRDTRYVSNIETSQKRMIHKTGTLKFKSIIWSLYESKMVRRNARSKTISRN